MQKYSLKHMLRTEICKVILKLFRATLGICHMLSFCINVINITSSNSDSGHPSLIESTMIQRKYRRDYQLWNKGT
ncbi:hypothetical protein WN48_10150 [Eufriesea mexicana]|nr:hypothetical protein WN48_10150 [Eufriesea mexicana]